MKINGCAGPQVDSTFRNIGSYAIGILILLCATAVASATSKDCSKDTLTDADKDLLFRLHENALIHDWVFRRDDKEPSPSCHTQPGYEYDLPTPAYASIEVLSLRELDQEGWFSFSLINSIEANEELHYAAVYSAAEFNDGQERYYLSCHREEIIPQLAVNLNLVGPFVRTIEVVIHSDEEDGERVGVTVSKTVFDYKIVLDVAIAIPSSFRKMVKDIAKELSMEQIETVAISNPVENPVYNDGHRENMYLIRGTDFDLAHLFDRLIKQLAPSAKNMIGRSCVFPAVSKVVGEITKRFEQPPPGVGVFYVVGHSLGGTAAQYIASDRQSEPSDYGSSEFAAHAFNGIGLQRDGNIKDLTSYIVYGDWLQMLPGNQVGTVVMYHPNDFTWRPLHRHGIEGVQRSLCRCWESQMGTLSVE